MFLLFCTGCGEGGNNPNGKHDFTGTYSSVLVDNQRSESEQVSFSLEIKSDKTVRFVRTQNSSDGPWSDTYTGTYKRDVSGGEHEILCLISSSEDAKKMYRFSFELLDDGTYLAIPSIPESWNESAFGHGAQGLITLVIFEKS